MALSSHLALELVVLVEVALQLLVHLLAGLVAVAHDETLHPMIAHRNQIEAHRIEVRLDLRLIGGRMRVGDEQLNCGEQQIRRYALHVLLVLDERLDNAAQT